MLSSVVEQNTPLAALHPISSLSSSAFTLTEASTLYYFAQPCRLNITIVYLSNYIWQRLLHRSSKFQGILYMDRTPYTASFKSRNSIASRWWTTLQLCQRHWASRIFAIAPLIWLSEIKYYDGVFDLERTHSRNYSCVIGTFAAYFFNLHIYILSVLNCYQSENGLRVRRSKLVQ